MKICVPWILYSIYLLSKDLPLCKLFIHHFSNLLFAAETAIYADDQYLCIFEVSLAASSKYPAFYTPLYSTILCYPFSPFSPTHVYCFFMVRERRSFESKDTFNYPDNQLGSISEFVHVLVLMLVIEKHAFYKALKSTKIFRLNLLPF